MTTLLAAHQHLRTARDIEAAPAIDPDEVRWVAGARSGDEPSIRLLLERYRSRAIRVAAHVLRNNAEAEDVAQEAFVRAFRSLRSLRGDAEFWPWLARIVVRLCLDRRRRAFWQRETHLEERPVAISTSESEATDLRVLVGELLDRLSPPLRAALVLSDLEGMDYAAVAAVLGIPVGTVRSRLHVARAQFKALWVDANPEEDGHG